MKSDHRHKHLTMLGTQLWFGPLFHVKNCLGSGGLEKTILGGRMVGSLQPPEFLARHHSAV